MFYRLKKTFLGLVSKLVENYVPRGIIFAIDLFFSFVALEITFFLLSTIKTSGVDVFNFSWEFFAILGIQTFYFFIFRTYSGLVRYSGFRDAVKQFKVTSACVATVLVGNVILFQLTGNKLILAGGIIIYGFVVFTMLFLFRVLVKQSYNLLRAKPRTSEAFVLGTNHFDVAIAEKLIAEPTSKFKLVGFINECDQKMRTRIFNLPILNMEQVKRYRSAHENISVIVGEKRLDKLNKEHSDTLTRLLDLKIKLYKLPDAQEWDGSTLTKKLKKINLEDLLQRESIKLDLNKLAKYYEDKVILVTGAAGSIGSEIVRQLIPLKPQKIVLLDQAETPLHELSLEMTNNYPNQDCEKIIANVRNKKRVQQVFDEFSPQVVFHGAAYKHVPMMESNPIEALHVNIQGSRNLADLSAQYDVERFVFVSTDKAVNPTNIMGASKRAAELYIQSLSQESKTKTTFITTRFGNVLGSNGSVIPHFKKQLENNGPITVTHPDIIRYFMTIDEACQLVLEAGGMGNGGEIYVFDMGEPVKILDLAKNMIRLSGLIPDEDIKIEFTGLRPGEKLYEELLADEATTLPTHHEKILIAQESHNFDDSKIEKMYDFFKVIQQNETREAICLLKAMVPEYAPTKEHKLDSKKNSLNGKSGSPSLKQENVYGNRKGA